MNITFKYDGETATTSVTEPDQVAVLERILNMVKHRRGGIIYCSEVRRTFSCDDCPLLFGKNKKTMCCDRFYKNAVVVKRHKLRIKQ